MWKHCCALVCAVAAFIVMSGLTTSAQDPSSQPLIQFGDLIYSGTFRLPRTSINGDDFSLGGRPFTFNPDRSSLFVGSKNGKIAEVNIPQIVNTTDVNGMFFANYLQGFVDPMEGNMWQVATDGAFIEGLMVENSQLYGTAAIFYDANNNQRRSHYSRSTNLSTPSFVGVAPVWQSDHSGFVDGYMAAVPAEWQTKLGGPAVTGQCCTPIAWKTSWGPAAFAFDPKLIGATTPVAAIPLLYYSNEHPTLGLWSESGAIYSSTARVNGLALIAGTRTALFVGSIGTGTPCYGNATDDPSLDHTTDAEGILLCYDPTNTDKGSHGYPYHYQIWAYDMNEFVAVKEGRKNPWDVKPYGVWSLNLPIPEVHARIGGIAYDAGRQIIYISQMFSDVDTFASRALVHAYRINGAPVTNNTPTAPTTTPPSGSGNVKTVAMTPNKAAPQAPGTTIQWTATPSGGITPYEYKWFLNDGSTWKDFGWSKSNTFDWTPTSASQYYRVAVWVRSYGAVLGDQPEASVEQYYVISGTATPGATTTPPPPPATGGTTSARATSVALTADKTAPQAPGTAITWSAVPVGGVAPHQYQWWIHDGTSWTSGPWTTSNTFVWQPAAANSNYRVAVWVRSAGSTGTYETSAEMYFVISGVAVLPPPPPPPLPPPPPVTTTSTRMQLVTLTADRVPPQAPGTTVTWTATPTGGTAPHEYQWWLFDGASWTAVTGWNTSATYAWTPSVANNNYRVAVWARSAGSTAGTYEVTAEKYFAISGAAVVTAPPPPPPATNARATGVSLASNLTAPQLLGSTITWTANASGGGTYEYQWWVYNGSVWTSAPWTTSNTFAWKPVTASSGSRVAVWVRSVGSTGTYETSAETYFAIWAAQ